MMWMGFNSTNIQRILDDINRVGGNLLQPTVSLCTSCHRHVPAWRYHLDNKVYLAKSCALHGVAHAMIESDYQFYAGLYYTQSNPRFNFNGGVLIEGSDRCNLDCPHCYHLPDNKIKDPSIEELTGMIRAMPIGATEVSKIILAGAESTLRKDFCELVSTIKAIDPVLDVTVMTNGITFADLDFVKAAKAAGLSSVNIGLNHKDYIDHQVVRDKQIRAINNLHDEGVYITYISYTMVDLSELPDILTEITSSFWTPKNFRIRQGSEIGRNASTDKSFVSDLYKAIEGWCIVNEQPFERIIQADNNIYHVMAKIGDKTIRIITWCDEENIDMEELRSGPWCHFVPDGITNFLHQIIRRDVFKNQSIALPDVPPERYKFNANPPDTPLDLLNLV
jgi:MoaA/NifB/PqqE/SkfB family radical SAM enzyme